MVHFTIVVAIKQKLQLIRNVNSMNAQHDGPDANHRNGHAEGRGDRPRKHDRPTTGNGHRAGGSNGRSRVEDWAQRIAADPHLFYAGADAGFDAPSAAAANGRNGNAAEHRDPVAAQRANTGEHRNAAQHRKAAAEHRNVSSSQIQLVASVDFPTRHGRFLMYGFLEVATGLEHTAVVKGDVRNAEGCPVRVHSECHTGDVWGSLRCDCRDQLEFALRYLGSAERGAIVYLRQEGRGIGLLNKLKAYRLQDLGLDTVEANQVLGYPAEGRDYRAAALILEMLGVISVELMSNNPDKIEKLRTDGVRVVGRIPVVSAPTAHNRFYLDTKRTKMGHLY